ncbi:glycosyl hydrolase family 28 protein [Flavitalea sp. BT771]|uniref:glycoside hydrolase family 28 protein n=1 Tax=Flavitalea sp. BT771 TaxID=3063329 RepID=UPI0026E3D720|nr:glycosyl hydrolase family 28 protein [Flavitalea sp. BT771]MDO6430956.1 glycosyl hydrolase family 28 protein [Flavitalea sp. BT771]MDV6219863.1 glycosyl hydrolase family 28 protein [Flavitalea sp. BT771]
MKNLVFIVTCTLVAGSCFAQARSFFNVLSYGARADGRTMNTRAIQKAIDAASDHGGGMVLVPAGRWVTGVLRLRSNVDLRLAENAVLLGSARRMDYGPGSASALIVADSQQNIAITGRGTIDGQGPLLIKDIYRMLEAGTLQDEEWKTYNPWHQMRPEERNRPKLIEIRHCQGVVVKGITIRDGLCWIQNYKSCSDITIDSIQVISNVMWNNDGIDLVDCRKVRVTHSFINADDDGICLKSEDAQGRCEDIYIADCTIRSSASALKLGTVSHGAFSNIRVRDLKIYDTYRSAIALETVDGATLEDIDIRNITATNTGNAIFLRLGRRNRRAPAGKLRRVYIGNVHVEVPAGKPDKGYEMEGPPVDEPHNIFPASITGLPDHPVEDVTLEDITVIYPGGASKDTAYRCPDSLYLVPEREEAYPEFSMFGELPASGLFVRHAKGLRFKKVRFIYKREDFRPAFVLDDVSGLVIERN